MVKKKGNWFTKATLAGAMNDPYSGAVMQASGFISDPKTGKVVQGDFSEEGATALRNSLAEIASFPLIELGVGLAGEAATSIPAIRRAVAATKVARELNRGAKASKAITKAAGRSGTAVMRDAPINGMSLDDYLSTYRTLSGAPRYSGYIETAANPKAAKFVEDVDEAVGWAVRRGDVKPPQRTLLKVYPKDYIGNGAESIVYKDPNDSNMVLKILKNSVEPDIPGAEMGFDTIDEAIEYGKVAVRNKNTRPYNLRENIAGVIENEFGKYSPVSTQQKVDVGQALLDAGQELPIDFFQRFERRIGGNGSWAGRYLNVKPNEIVYENGFIEPHYDTFGRWDGTFRSKDFAPKNIGILEDGTQMGIDLRKYGGLLSRLKAHYGDDDKIRQAIIKARGGKIETPVYDPDKLLWSPNSGAAPLPYDWDAFKLRQYWGESRFRNNLTSPAGAKGAFQIMPITQKDYILRGGTEGDLMDKAYNEGVRDDLVALLRKDSYFDEANTSPESFAAMVAGAYNKGLSGFKKELKKLEAAGYDIRRSTDWVDAFPANKNGRYETRNYMKWVGLGQDTGGDLTNEAFNAAVEKHGFGSGGKIHIKKKNRGKFTALKKRTGHSASWFKAHGTPAQKKMAVFELNSRKWSHKHADGGYLLGNVYDLTEEQINELIRQGYEVERV